MSSQTTGQTGRHPLILGFTALLCLLPPVGQVQAQDAYWSLQGQFQNLMDTQSFQLGSTPTIGNGQALILSNAGGLVDLFVARTGTASMTINGDGDFHCTSRWPAYLPRPALHRDFTRRLVEPHQTEASRTVVPSILMNSTVDCHR